LQTAINNASITLRSSIEQPGKALAQIKAEEGEVVSTAVVMKAVEKVASALNIGKNLSATQILDIAVLTCKEYFYLTEAQLQVLVQRIMLNKYSQVKIYDSVDCLKWFEYIEAFIQDLNA